MAVEAFDFNCAVVLPDGEAAQVEQVGIGRGTRQDMTFYMQVRRPTNLDACPGETVAQSRQR